MNSRNDDYGLIPLSSVSTLLFGYSSAMTMSRKLNTPFFNDFFAKMEVDSRQKYRQIYLDLEKFLKWWKENLFGDFLVKYSDYRRAIGVELTSEQSLIITKDIQRFGGVYHKLSDLNNLFEQNLTIREVLQKVRENKK